MTQPSVISQRGTVREMLGPEPSGETSGRVKCAKTLKKIRPAHVMRPGVIPDGFSSMIPNTYDVRKRPSPYGRVSVRTVTGRMTPQEGWAS